MHCCPPTAQAAVQQLLVTLHEKSAEAGSATGALQVRPGCLPCSYGCPQPAGVLLCWLPCCRCSKVTPIAVLHWQPCLVGSLSLQVARCREFGLLVPQDHAAAFKAYAAAAKLGSAEGALRCGIHYFEGTAPAGGRHTGWGQVV